MTEETGGQTNTDTAGEAQTGSAESAEATHGETNGATADEGTQQQQEGNESTEGEESSAPEVPESYEFELPEGVELDKSLAEAATPVFKELGLTQEQAQQLAQLYVDNMQAQSQSSQDAFKSQLDKWQNDLKADEEFGGDNYEQNTAKVAEFVSETVPEGLKDELIGMLNSTGVGSHPAMVKYFHHLAGMMPVSEDQPPGGQPSMDNASIASRWYGNDGGLKTG